MSKKHNAINVVNQLSKKHDLFIDPPIIQLLPKTKQINDLGNKSWGKIDFLVNHCNYFIQHL